ncbi:O-antigen polysaccharide polymerase Wzy [Nocardioides sediminis]|uniref:O-antigen polysaccharide polymerase Wzy n=1 Tax=Nocardioides sediminis TaxID=433648 RepID=UPI000D3267A5|nr:O-antigen polysaccharide polymerase Wzy [Nocardioides sediminis]
MVIVLALIYVFVMKVVISRRSDVDGLLSPIVIVAFSILFYTISVPVELWLRDSTLLGFTQKHMTPTIAERSVVAAILGLIALYIGYSSLARRAYAADLQSSSGGVQTARFVTLLSALLGALLLSTIFHDNVLAAQDYLSNVAQTASGAGETGYFLVNRWTYLSYGMFAFLSIARSTRVLPSLMWLLPLCAWSVYSNDKDPLLVALLALSGTLFCGLKRRDVPSGGVVAAAMVGVLVFVGLGAALYGVVRAGESVNRAALAEYFNGGLFTNIDPAGPSAVLAVVLRQEPGTGSFVPTIVNAFSPVPSIVRPFDVGEDIAVTFARLHFPNWAPGYGYGYSPIAEGWGAAGYVGVALIFFFVGLMLGAIRNWLLKPSEKHPQTAVVRLAAYFVVLGYLSFTFMRGTTTSLLSNAATCAALVVLLSVVCTGVASRRRSSGVYHRRRQA